MKQSVIKKIFFLILFLLLSSSVSAVTVLPAGISEYEFIYDRIERYETISPDKYYFQQGPYNNLHYDFKPFSFLENKRSEQLSLFTIVGEDFQSEKESYPSSLESLRGGFTAQPFKNSFVYADFILDEARAKDETYTGKKWRGLAGEVEEAFLYYHSQKFDLLIGRFASFWGVRKSLVLSSANRLDGFGYTFKWGRLSLSYRLGKLNQTVDSLTYLNRYFAGHRLDIHLSKKLRMGFFESIVFGGKGRQIELNYLNPIIFFHADQLNDNTDDNTFLGFDYNYKQKKGIKLYGQILIDDYQIEKSNPGDDEPNQYAIHVGGFFVNILKNTDFRTEYTRVTNWTFNQQHEHNQYLFNMQPLADVIDNDYDLLKMKLYNWLKPDKAVSFNFSYMRRGEGGIINQWTAPWLLSSDGYSEKFPTGTVEKTMTLSLSSEGFYFNHIYLNFETGFKKIKNYQHIPEADKTLQFINIKLSTFISTDINIGRND